MPKQNNPTIFGRRWGYIRIFKVPKGEAPLKIREKWVGIVLPCDPIAGYSDNKTDYSILTRQQVEKFYGFSVPQDLAIENLEQINPEAANWWKNLGFPKPNEYFGFRLDEAVVVAGVTFQKIIHVPEEAQGHINR